MKEILLTQGMTAIVDDEDYEGLIKWKWHCVPRGRRHYAMREIVALDGQRKRIRMHRVILNTPPGYETDHINGNGLDNRKENLRVASTAQNRYNTDRQRNNTSGFKGVGWHKGRRKWQAQIQFCGKQFHLGYFKDKLEAAITYNITAIKYYGAFARLNQVGD